MVARVKCRGVVRDVASEGDGGKLVLRELGIDTYKLCLQLGEFTLEREWALLARLAPCDGNVVECFAGG